MADKISADPFITEPAGFGMKETISPTSGTPASIALSRDREVSELRTELVIASFELRRAFRDRW